MKTETANTWIPYLIALFTVVAAAAAVTWLWLSQRKKNAAPAEPASPAPAPEQPSAKPNVTRSIDEAQRALSTSSATKGLHLCDLPLFLLIGPRGCGKTSVIENSGLARTLLSGQVASGSEIIPTAGVNVWLLDGTVCIEVAESVALDPDSMQSLLRHLAPRRIKSLSRGPSPVRCVCVCADTAAVSGVSAPEAAADLARPWHACLESCAAAFGVQIPVYVLFTRTDTVPSFDEYFAALAGKEAHQTLGTTLPMHPVNSGVYAQEMGSRLETEFSKLFASLCDHRVTLLSRGGDAAKLPIAYQFPRSFQRNVQRPAVEFLIALTRPSMLHTSPLLRGFYFLGSKVRSADEKEPGFAAPVLSQPTVVGATSVMTAEQLQAAYAGRAAAPPNMAAPRREWLFTRSAVDLIFFRDTAAHGLTAVSSRADRFRAIAFSCLAACGLLLLVAVTVSFARNRSLERELAAAATPPPAASPLRDPAPRIEKLRPPVDRLLTYAGGAVPLSMRWGLYNGDNLFPPARTAYCAAMKQGPLQSLVQRLTATLSRLGREGGDNASGFDTLKAYMMLTSWPQMADANFLEQIATGTAKGSGEASSPLAAEVRTYARLLASDGGAQSCAFPADAALIAGSQRYLRSLHTTDHYASLLQQAGRGLEPVDYGKLFPNDAVSDARVVPGWFTKQGWAKMQEILAHPAESLKADAWVLGTSRDLSPSELESLSAQYRARYLSEFSKTWREFLSATRVTPYASLDDAAAKLEKISGQRSVLLNLVGIAAEHTSASDARNAFQATKAVVPAPADFQPAAEYLKQLDQLKNRLSRAAQSTGAAHDQDTQDVRNAATSAQDAVDQIARGSGFKGDADQVVKAILLMPITQISPLLNKQNALTAAASAADLCRFAGQIAPMLPFSPRNQQNATLDDVQRLLQPEHGQMWQMYNDTLKDSLDCNSSDCTLRGNPKLNLSPAFVDFFRNLNRWSRLIYNGAPEPLLRLQITATPLNHLKELQLTIDDQKTTLAPGKSASLVWDPRRTNKLQITGVFEDEPQTQDLFPAEGPWSIFSWLFDAEPGSGGANGFTWLPRAGQHQPSLLKNGNTKRYKVEVRDSTGRPLDVRPLTLAGCANPAR